MKPVGAETHYVWNMIHTLLLIQNGCSFCRSSTHPAFISGISLTVCTELFIFIVINIS